MGCLSTGVGAKLAHVEVSSPRLYDLIHQGISRVEAIALKSDIMDNRG